MRFIPMNKVQTTLLYIKAQKSGQVKNMKLDFECYMNSGALVKVMYDPQITTSSHLCALLILKLDSVMSSI